MRKRPTRREVLSGAAISLLGASATGAEAASQQLAAGDAAGIGFDPGARGAVGRSVEGRLRDSVSVLDFIPSAEHAAIRARTSTADVARHFTAAIAHIDSVGGGELHIPAGRYRCGSTVQLCNKLHMRGLGKAHIQFTHAGTNVPNGSGFKLIQPSNTSTGAYTKLTDIYVEMINRSNAGACFYDNCSTYLTLRDCIFSGGKFGVIFDQTEISGIYSCEMSAQLPGGAGLWLVNGPDITPGNRGLFTNQITVDHGCQFNQGPAYAIIDDGGDAHYYGNNNINGGGMKFAGVTNLTIMGGEMEAVNGRPGITFGSTAHYSGGAAGNSSAIIMNLFLAQPAGHPPIRIDSMNSLFLVRAQLHAGGRVAAHISGMSNLGSYFGRLNVNGNDAIPLLDSYAGGGHDDGTIPVRTTASSAYTLLVSDYNALLQTTSGSAVAIVVPANAALAFPIGTRIMIEQNGAGPVTLRAGRGVTLDGTLSTGGRHQTLTLVKTAADRWLATRQA